jgi:hypothetical protein
VCGGEKTEGLLERLLEEKAWSIIAVGKGDWGTGGLGEGWVRESYGVIG